MDAAISILVVTSVLMFPRYGMAAEVGSLEPSPEQNENQERHDVEVHVLAPTRSPKVLDKSIVAWLEERSWAPRTVREKSLDYSRVLVAPETPGMAVWIHEQKRGIVIYFVLRTEGGAVRYLFRDVPHMDASDAIVAETLGQIVAVSVDALFSGEEEVSREEIEAEIAREGVAASPPTRPVSPPLARRVAEKTVHRSWAVVVGSLVQWNDLERLSIAPRLGLDFYFSHAWSLRPRLAGILPHTETIGDVSLDFVGAGASLPLGFRVALGETIWAQMILGPGIEFMRVEGTSSSLAGLKLGPATTLLRPELKIGIGLEVEIRRILVGLRTEVSWLPTQTRYAYLENGVSTTLGASSPWNLGAGLEVAF